MAASRAEVAERVKEVLVEQLGIDESEITDEASFQEDLDADSLDLVELIMELEDAVAEKLEPFVRVAALLRPRGVREDLFLPSPRELVDQPLELEPGGAIAIGGR